MKNEINIIQLQKSTLVILIGLYIDITRTAVYSLYLVNNEW